MNLFWAKSELFFCLLYLYLGICVFALNLRYWGGLFDLIPLMGFLGLSIQSVHILYCLTFALICSKFVNGM